MVPQNITVRPMTENDISRVLEIDRALVGRRRVLTYANPVESYIGGSLAASWVVEVEDRVVGFVLCRMTEPGLSRVSSAVIELIGVDPDFQRQGVGKAIVAQLLEQCQEKKVQQVSIVADRHDEVLRHFFSSLGFKEGEHINYTLNLEE